MEDQKPTSFTFEIDSFSEKEGAISSGNFLSGGCEWQLRVYPKRHVSDDNLYMYLYVANYKSLRLGWKRRASYSLILLNQSGKEFFRSPESCGFFCAQFPGWGLPLKKLQVKGFLERNKLIVKVEVKVIEVVDEGGVTGNEIMDVRGFQVPYSQVRQVTRIFMEHPGIASNFIPKSQLVKTTYMNLLRGLIDKLNQPPRSFTKNELSNARSELIDLEKAGFKLDWLKRKLDDVCFEWKKANDDDSRVQELEEQVKNLNLELDTEKVKSATSAAKVLSLEQTVSDLRVELLSKEKAKATPKDVLEGVVRSWEVLDYADLSNEKVE